MTADPLAVVIGDMDLVRPLGLAGIPVVVASVPTKETQWSRHVGATLDLPDLWADPVGCVDALEAFAAPLDVKPVLFYQKDPALLAISRHRDRLSKVYSFVVPDADLVETLVDKSRFDLLCDEMSLPVPTTVIVEGGDWVPELDNLPYPVIVKPAVRRHSEDRWFPLVGRSSKAFRAESRDRLSEFLSEPSLSGIRLVVQQMIDGPEDRIWSYHAFIDESGSTIGEFVGRKIRTWPQSFGQSTAVEIVNDERVTSTGRKVLADVGLTGVAKVDFKLDASGNLYLFEINPRFSLWHHPAAVAGLNIPLMVYNTILGRPVASATARQHVKWCQVWGDASAARDVGIGFFEWARFAVGAEARRAAHLSDPGSALGALAHGLALKARRRNA